MNRNDFTGLIRNPGKLNRQAAADIKELLELFPWFHSAHLLLLKSLQNTGDVRFETQLRQSAIHIADREILYYILKESKADEVQTSSEIPNSPGMEKEGIREIQVESEQVVIETGRNSEEVIQELEKLSVLSGDSHEPAKDSSSDPVEKLIVTAESETDESASVVLVIDDGDSHFEETIVFMDPSINTEEAVELLELDESLPFSEKSSSDELLQPQSDSDLKEEKRKSQAELIDRFILANPRIEPNREKMEIPGDDLSKPFTEERGELVTETLARIYIKQGYYSKAMDIYEKLSLKYPEKSSYFATQIQKVKALIKQ